jgi:hypothetical protein
MIIDDGRSDFTKICSEAPANPPRSASKLPTGPRWSARRRKAMLKTSLMAAFMVVLAIGPAYAAQDLCNDAHMKLMDDTIAKMTDAAKMKEATTALDMSKAAMKKGDTAGCMQHMEEAHKAMGM